MTDDDFRRVVRYFTVVLRGLFVLGGVFSLIIMGGSYFLNSLPTTYKATATIEIKPGADIVTTDADSTGPISSADVLRIMISPRMLSTVISDLDLDTSWARRLSGSETRWTEDQATARLQKNLRIEPKPGTDLVEITAFSDLASESAQIANQLVENYRARHPGPPEVLIVQRAQKPLYASWPNRRLYMRIVYALATLLSIGVASSVEMVFLILRASERPEN